MNAPSLDKDSHRWDVLHAAAGLDGSSSPQSLLVFPEGPPWPKTTISDTNVIDFMAALAIETRTSPLHPSGHDAIHKAQMLSLIFLRERVEAARAKNPDMVGRRGVSAAQALAGFYEVLPYLIPTDERADVDQPA